MASSTTTTTTTTAAMPPPSSTSTVTTCPYLDTINRTVLDFDSPSHACSITLESSPHIYACLVCGKFFRGKGRQTPAYTHSVEEGHFVFVHLTKGTFHCLPDDYEVSISEPSLQDIRLALHPTFSEGQVAALDGNEEVARDLFGRRYLPGFVGLNNLNRTDYLNVVVQALGHVKPLRDFFLLAANNNSHAAAAAAAAATVTNQNNPLAASSNSKRKQHDQHETTYSNFSPLAKSFSLLLRNMWSSHRFKSNVDPHMLVQAVSVASNKRYHVGSQSEAGEFLAWLLHQLHVGIGGTVSRPAGKKKRKKKKGSNSATRSGTTVIHDTFMGRVEMTTVVRRRRRRGETAALEMLNQGGMDTSSPSANDSTIDVLSEDDRDGSDDEQTILQKQRKRETARTLANETVVVEEETVLETDFLQLTLDIPEKPLFKDEDGGLVIPQEPLANVLRKFDGVSFGDALSRQQQQQRSSERTGEDGTVVSRERRYRLRKLPNYLILHLSRFKRNGYFVEKNPTIVMFPVKNFDLSQYVFPEGGRESVPSSAEVKAMSTRELKNLLTKYGRGDLANDAIEKPELLQHAMDFLTTSLPDLLTEKYNLVANITHDIPVEVGREGKQRNPLEEGSYRCHVQHQATGQWYEIQDLNVRETMPQLIGVSESYLLIFERKGCAV